MTAAEPRRAGVGQIHHLVINVRDLDTSVAFYRDVLGLHYDGTADVGGIPLSTLIRIPAGSRGRVAFLNAGHGMGRVELVEWQGTAQGQPPASPGPRHGAALGLAIASFLLREPELRALYDRVHQDWECWSAPVSFDVAGQTLVAFIVEDPDGNPLEFFSFG
jgi:catechol 2,3-dioxygenase-like lactoylglutathione lyase family enzyme